MVSAIGGGMVVIGALMNVICVVGCLTMHEKATGEKHEFWSQVVLGCVPVVWIVLGMLMVRA